jgi:hypothetical protein
MKDHQMVYNSGHYLENRTGSRSGVEDITTSANSTASNSTNVILSISFHKRIAQDPI